MNPNIDPYWRNNNMLNGVDEDTPIYKYMPLRYTLAMIQTRQLVLNRVNTWEDVYENYILKQDYEMQGGGHVDVINQADGIYGQCWTVKRDSDAMWRIYSQDKETIRIKTTVGKLFDTLYVTNQNMADTYIGRVLYQDQAQIDADVQALSPMSVGDFQHCMIKGAFVKRIEFDHEEEVRIVRIMDSQDTFLAGNLLYFNIDIDFIEELCIDPRVDDAMEQNIRTQLVAAGAPAHMVIKSQLYSFNSHRIIFQ
jgi:hypothetical protein